MRANGDSDQAGSGGRASIYGQEIIVNKSGLVRSLRNTRSRQETIAFCGTFSSVAPGERSVGRRGALHWQNLLASESGPDPRLWSFPPWRPVPGEGLWCSLALLRRPEHNPQRTSGRLFLQHGHPGGRQVASKGSCQGRNTVCGRAASCRVNTFPSAGRIRGADWWFPFFLGRD